MIRFLILLLLAVGLGGCDDTSKLNFVQIGTWCRKDGLYRVFENGIRDVRLAPTVGPDGKPISCEAK